MAAKKKQGGREQTPPVELLEMRSSHELKVLVAKGFFGLAGLAVASYPLRIVSDMVRPFAGVSTNLDVNVTLSIVVTVSVVANIAQWARGRARKQELKRLRNRVDDLEGRLLAVATTQGGGK